MACPRPHSYQLFEVRRLQGETVHLGNCRYSKVEKHVVAGCCSSSSCTLVTFNQSLPSPLKLKSVCKHCILIEYGIGCAQKSVTNKIDTT